MLVIRDEQMKALQQYAFNQFVDRMMRHLQTTCYRWTESISNAALRIEVEAGIEQAAKYDIESEFDVQQFLECRTKLGTDFDTNPGTAWAGEILRNDELTASEKMDIFSDRLAFNLEES